MLFSILFLGKRRDGYVLRRLKLIISAALHSVRGLRGRMASQHPRASNAFRPQQNPFQIFIENKYLRCAASRYAMNMRNGKSHAMTSPKLKALLVVPDTNTTMLPEIAAHWPALGEVIRVGIPRPPRPIVVSDLAEYRAATLAAVRPLIKARPDIVLYGCTTAGFLAGPAGDREMCDALADAVGVPAVTTAYAMVEALRHANIQRPAVVTPYLQASNDGRVAPTPH
jgi:Arylmalonate decarboxylase